MIIKSIKQNLFIFTFVISCFVVGIVYTFIWKPGYIYDELTHYRTSYSYSNIIIGVEGTQLGENYEGVKGISNARIKIRKCDEPLFGPDGTVIPSLFEKEFFNNSDEYVDADAVICSYFPFPTYIIDTVGIIVGRVFFNLGSISLFYFIRWINLCFYIVAGILAIRVAPQYKEFLYVLFLLPTCLSRGASAGYESLYFPFTWLYIFFVLSTVLGECRIDNKRRVQLFLFSVLISPIKGLGFFLVGLLLLIRNERFDNGHDRRRFLVTVIILSMLIWLVYNLLSVGISDVFLLTQTRRIIEYTGSEAIYISDFIRNPLFTLQILYNTFNTKLINSFRLVADTSLVETYGEAVQTVFLLLLIYSIPGKKEDSVLFSWQKVIVGIICFAIFGTMCVETLVSFGGSDLIYAPIKTTYLVPFIPLLIAMFRTKAIKYTGNIREQVIIIFCILMHVIGTTSVIQTQITNGLLANT